MSCTCQKQDGSCSCAGDGTPSACGRDKRQRKAARVRPTEQTWVEAQAAAGGALFRGPRRTTQSAIAASQAKALQGTMLQDPKETLGMGVDCGSGKPSKVGSTQSAGGAALRQGRGKLPRAVLLPGMEEAPLTMADGRVTVDGTELHLRTMEEGTSETSRRHRPPSVADLMMATDPIKADDRGLDLTRPAGEPSSGSPLEHMVSFAYRDTAFLLPLSWFNGYRGDLLEQHRMGSNDAGYGKVTAPSVFLAWVWADLMAAGGAAGITDTTFWFDMLGCYNLPREDMPGAMPAMFWHAGWGPPYQVYVYTNMLVVGYASYIEDICTGHPYCEDLGDFVRNALRGKAQEDEAGGGPCRVAFRFMNSDTDNAFVRNTGIAANTFDCGTTEGETYRCDEGFAVGDSIDPGLDWDFGLPPELLDHAANAFVARNSATGTHPSASMSEPNYYSYAESIGRAYVSTGTWTITMRPELLAWHSFVCDWILYLARMANDYAYDFTNDLTSSERSEYHDKAYQLGRYAVRVLSLRGRNLIHEFGHVHNGVGGHCGAGSCCFELAAEHWMCGLSAVLGLPVDSGNSHASSTWRTTGWSDWNYHCLDRSAEAEETGTFTLRPWYPWAGCTVFEPGDSGSSWEFWCNGCWDTTTTTVRYLR